MSKTMHDLLVEERLTFRDVEGRPHVTTLPGILAALSAERVGDFPRVRAHQFHSWCMFLTQLAFLGLQRANLDEPPTEPEAWTRLLRALAPSAPGAFALVVEALDEPAFMQAPVPKVDIEGWESHKHPDDLDMLVTSKNHDVKMSVMDPRDAEAWTYSLVQLQTAQGYLGPGNYGITRMNGGFGSRPRVGLSPSNAPGPRFRRDLRALASAAGGSADVGLVPDGHVLLWLEPWDGVRALDIGEVSPGFIEICRRIRLCDQGGYLCARYTGSKSQRLAGTSKGNVGDPWIPVDVAHAAALTLSEGGFGYAKLSEILVGQDYKPAPAQAPLPGDPPAMLLMASCLVRGQGKTQGLHERIIPLSPAVTRRLGMQESRDELGKRSRRFIDDAKTVRTKILFPALKKVWPAGSDLPPDGFDARVDGMFFESLLGGIEAPIDIAKAQWRAALIELASEILEAAIASSPLPDARRYRCIAEATGLFAGLVRKHEFPETKVEVQA